MKLQIALLLSFLSFFQLTVASTLQTTPLQPTISLYNYMGDGLSFCQAPAGDLKLTGASLSQNQTIWSFSGTRGSFHGPVRVGPACSLRSISPGIIELDENGDLVVWLNSTQGLRTFSLTAFIPDCNTAPPRPGFGGLLRGDSGLDGYDGRNGTNGKDGKNGATGPRGARGVTGSTGATGPSGSTGPRGPHGPTGFTGAQGRTGRTGATGKPGNTGNTGTRGHTGATGWTGVTGRKGATGHTGPTGATGGDGKQGLPGPRGIPGVTGPTGPQGPQGPRGPQGAIGKTGFGLTGPRGPKGYTGPPGFRGSTGGTGQTGPRGLMGLRGPTGKTGITGLTGARGSRGPSSFYALSQKSSSFVRIDPPSTVFSSFLLNGTAIDGLALGRTLLIRAAIAWPVTAAEHTIGFTITNMEPDDTDSLPYEYVSAQLPVGRDIWVDVILTVQRDSTIWISLTIPGVPATFAQTSRLGRRITRLPHEIPQYRIELSSTTFLSQEVVAIAWIEPYDLAI